MHHPHDQRFKALVAACMDVAVDVALESAVHVPAQRIDFAYEPRVRVPQLGVMDRMTALGPGMMEYFASVLSEADVMSCVRKRLNYVHERTLRGRGIGAPEPLLWILAARRISRTVVENHELAPMPGWPLGFRQARALSWMRFVALEELPRDNDTLFLRLCGHGRTLQLAVEELRALPADHVLQRARPVLVAYRPTIMQDFKELNDMNALQEALAIYDEWERRTKRTAQAELLLLQLTDSFGAVPAEMVERIQEASSDALERWARRVRSAQSLADVFA